MQRLLSVRLKTWVSGSRLSPIIGSHCRKVDPVSAMRGTPAVTLDSLG